MSHIEHVVMSTGAQYGSARWVFDNSALFNLNSTSGAVSVNWINLGYSGSASVRDLWGHQELGSVSDAYTVTLNSHASVLLRVRPEGQSQAISRCELGGRYE
jgi:hypothetical protein